MDSKQQRNRIVLALLVFGVLVGAWAVLALQLSAAAASPLGFPFNFRSGLAADYGSDPGAQPIVSLRFAIITDFLQDLGIPLRGGAGFSFGLDGPVPTATALNFAGDPPHTSTPPPTVPPSATPRPTTIPTATLTSTLTKVPPTKTPTPTKTEEGPAPSPTAGGDTQAPTVSGGTLVPPPGALPSCTESLYLADLHVVDPAASSGMKWVKMKYKILGPGSKGYVYSDALALSAGGWTGGPGSTWDGYYNGPVTIDFDTGYATLWMASKALAKPFLSAPTDTPTPEPTATTPPPPPSATPTGAAPTPTPTPDPFEIELWAIVKDNAGHSSYILLGTYTMPGFCDS